MRYATLLVPGRGETPAVISPDGSRYHPLDGPKPLAERLSAPLPRPDADWDEAPHLSDVRFAPLIPRPGSLWCVGLNYEDHRLETGRAKADYPTLFTRFRASLLGHGEALVRPAVSHQLDFEGELAVVIGRSARHVSEEAALDHVAGYACFNDASVRDYQGHSSQFGPGKNFWRTGGFGPFLVTPDEVPDPQDLPIETRLNGEVVQQSHTSQMTYPVRELIAYLSRIHPLFPGDVISTGTPSGVGVARDPQLFMKPGDVVEVEIGSVGVLRNGVADEEAADQ
ncbi:MAG: fumarylacetoacetate hydrolase family protein [Acidobacteria bacterium]|nr:fumarylacetoacetate hydrolase family protein [Acidobacteriota bacterium]